MTTPLRSADILVDRILGILNDPTKKTNLLNSPETTLKEMAEEVTASLPPPPTVTDSTIYHIVTISLGFVAIGAVIGAIWLTLSAQEVPDILTALGAGAVGAMAGLLAPPAK
jgi:hypothetical protein